MDQLQQNCFHEVIGDLLRANKFNHTGAYILDIMIARKNHRFVVAELAKRCVVSRAIMFKYLQLFKDLGLLKYSKYRFLGSKNKIVYSFKADKNLIKLYNEKMLLIDNILGDDILEITTHLGRNIDNNNSPSGKTPRLNNLAGKISELSNNGKNPNKNSSIRLNNLANETRTSKKTKNGFPISITTIPNTIIKNKNYKKDSINDKLNKRHTYENSQKSAKPYSNVKDMLKPSKKYGTFSESEYQTILDDFNDVGRFTKARFRMIDDTIKLIRALLEVGYTLDDFKAAHRGMHSQTWYLKRGLFTPGFLYTPKNFEKFSVLKVSEEVAEEEEDDPSKLSETELKRRVVNKTATSSEIDLYWKKAPERERARKIKEKKLIY